MWRMAVSIVTVNLYHDNCLFGSWLFCLNDIGCETDEVLFLNSISTK